MGALYLTDIDLKEGFINIRRSITRTEDGKYIVGDAAKTVKSLRDIPLTNEIIIAVKNQKS
ncbi:MAG: hypothetical protein IJ167_05945 [Lachnospiraceae bacterium]|nr:hypothetical protein [Lachnospiraceae bacterium]